MLLIGLLFLFPFALPLLGLALVGLRRRWASWTALAWAGMGGFAYSAIVWDHPADSPWWSVLFLPATVTAAWTLRTGSMTARVATVLAALLLVGAGVAFGIWRRLTYVSCTM